MIQSMTGYGRASAGQGNNKISIIIRSVNGRFLDLKLRGFDIDPSVDKKIRDLISDRLIRGTVHINFESETSQGPESHIFNEDRFKLLLKICDSIEKKYNLKLNEKGNKIIYIYDTKNQSTGITSLLQNIREEGIKLRDINTEQSSLESIFIDLVKGSNNELLRG